MMGLSRIPFCRK